MENTENLYLDTSKNQSSPPASRISSTANQAEETPSVRWLISEMPPYLKNNTYFDLTTSVAYIAIYELYGLQEATITLTSMMTARLLYLNVVNKGKVELIYWTSVLFMLAFVVPTLFIENEDILKLKPVASSLVAALVNLTFPLFTGKSYNQALCGDLLEKHYPDKGGRIRSVTPQEWKKLDYAWSAYFVVGAIADFTNLALFASHDDAWFYLKEALVVLVIAPLVYSVRILKPHLEKSSPDENKPKLSP